MLDHIDAAVSLDQNTTLVFLGGLVLTVEFPDRKVKKAPQSVLGRWPEIPSDWIPFDAVTLGMGHPGNLDLIVFFKGDSCLMIDKKSGKMVQGPTKLTEVWPKWPSGFWPIDTAVSTPEGYLEAFKFSGKNAGIYWIDMNEQVSKMPSEIYSFDSFTASPNGWPKDWYPADAMLVLYENADNRRRDKGSGAGWHWYLFKGANFDHFHGNQTLATSVPIEDPKRGFVGLPIGQASGQRSRSASSFFHAISGFLPLITQLAPIIKESSSLGELQTSLKAQDGAFNPDNTNIDTVVKNFATSEPVEEIARQYQAQGLQSISVAVGVQAQAGIGGEFAQGVNFNLETLPNIPHPLREYVGFSTLGGYAGLEAGATSGALVGFNWFNIDDTAGFYAGGSVEAGIVGVLSFTAISTWSGKTLVAGLGGGGGVGASFTGGYTWSEGRGRFYV